MIKTFAIVIISLFLSSGIMAQKYQKEWSDGKLTWQDFSERESSQGVSELKYVLGYHTDKQKFGDTVILRNKAICYMDKNLSWINPAYKTDQYLRYNQVIFDIVEIHRRRLQFELDRLNFHFNIDETLKHIHILSNEEIDRFNQESKGGQDLSVIAIWERKTKEKLRNSHANNIPEIETRNFGYGLHAGLGSGFSTGSLNEHFDRNLNFMFGFDIAYKKSILYLNGTFAISNIKKDYMSDISFYEDQRAYVTLLDISYGYALIDNDRFKISPFAGLGITEYSTDGMDEDDNGLWINDYNILFGINTDYKIRTRLKLLPNPFFGVKEKVETSIRARLYVARAKFYGDLQGYTINFSIGLCGFGNMIHLK